MIDDAHAVGNGNLCAVRPLSSHMADAMRECHALCDDKKDVATASLLEIYIDETERRIWFLFEASRGSDADGH